MPYLKLKFTCIKSWLRCWEICTYNFWCHGLKVPCQQSTFKNLKVSNQNQGDVIFLKDSDWSVLKYNCNFADKRLANQNFSLLRLRYNFTSWLTRHTVNRWCCKRGLQCYGAVKGASIVTVRISMCSRWYYRSSLSSSITGGVEGLGMTLRLLFTVPSAQC